MLVPSPCLNFGIGAGNRNPNMRALKDLTAEARHQITEEMGFLGLSFTASLQNATRTAPRRRGGSNRSFLNSKDGGHIFRPADFWSFGWSKYIKISTSRSLEFSTATARPTSPEAWKIITVACIPPLVLLLAGLGGNSLLSRKRKKIRNSRGHGEAEIRWIRNFATSNHFGLSFWRW